MAGRTRLPELLPDNAVTDLWGVKIEQEPELPDPSSYCPARADR